METKTYIWIGVLVGSTIGSVVGSMLDHGNFLGGWSIALGAVGSFVGVWAGYRLGNG